MASFWSRPVPRPLRHRPGTALARELYCPFRLPDEAESCSWSLLRSSSLWSAEASSGSDGKSSDFNPGFYSQEWSISKFPCSLTRNITSHSIKNLAFHSLLRWKMIDTLHCLTTSAYTFLFKRSGRCTFWATAQVGFDASHFRSIVCPITHFEKCSISYVIWGWTVYLHRQIGNTPFCLPCGHLDFGSAVSYCTQNI